MEKSRIMIVEDEVIIAMLLKQSLTHLGYDVVAVVDKGEEAVKIADQVRPDLISMDISLMGEMDGIEAAYEVCNRFDIPVIYLSAFLDDAILNRAKESGAFAYLSKPVDDIELKEAVESALAGEKVEYSK